MARGQPADQVPTAVRRLGFAEKSSRRDGVVGRGRLHVREGSGVLSGMPALPVFALGAVCLP
jgi:hypothetical protein